MKSSIRNAIMQAMIDVGFLATPLIKSNCIKSEKLLLSRKDGILNILTRPLHVVTFNPTLSSTILSSVSS